MSKKTETKVSETLTQRPIPIKIGRNSYNVPRPTFGTLVLVSEAIASGKKLNTSEDTFVEDALRDSKDAVFIAEVLAIFILGAKKLKSLFGNFQKTRLMREILDHCTLEDVNDGLITMVNAMGAQDFFAVITFLEGIQVTKPTKVTKTTALGQ